MLAGELSLTRLRRIQYDLQRASRRIIIGNGECIEVAKINLGQGPQLCPMACRWQHVLKTGNLHDFKRAVWPLGFWFCDRRPVELTVTNVVDIEVTIISVHVDDALRIYSLDRHWLVLCNKSQQSLSVRALGLKRS